MLAEKCAIRIVIEKKHGENRVCVDRKISADPGYESVAMSTSISAVVRALSGMINDIVDLGHNESEKEQAREGLKDTVMMQLEHELRKKGLDE